MKRIQLTQGQFALVDDEDFEELSKFKWHAEWNPRMKSFYAKRGSREKTQRTIRMHRVIMKASKGVGVDHLNHNTLDNRKENLRVCSQRVNMSNRKHHSIYGVGVKKMQPMPSGNMRINNYTARIHIGRKDYHLGYFLTPELAQLERRKAEFACALVGV